MIFAAMGLIFFGFALGMAIGIYTGQGNAMAYIKHKEEKQDKYEQQPFCIYKSQHLPNVPEIKLKEWIDANLDLPKTSFHGNIKGLHPFQHNISEIVECQSNGINVHGYYNFTINQWFRTDQVTKINPSHWRRLV